MNSERLYTVTFWKQVPGTEYAQRTGTIVQQSILQHDVHATSHAQAKRLAIQNCERELSATDWFSVSASVWPES